MRLRAFIVLWVWTILPSIAIPFHTKELQQIAASLALELPRAMPADSNNDSTWTYNGKMLRVCTNRFGEVSHIGYRLFGNETLRAQGSLYVLTFIERFFLALDLTRNLEEKLRKLELSNVVILKGELSQIKNIDALTPFNIEYIVRRGYRATWTMGDNQRLSISFPADCQLLLGCNAIELEEMIGRDLRRQKVATDDMLAPWADAKETLTKDTKILDLGDYLSPLIGSKLYMTRQADGGWQVEQSSQNKTRSVCNTMLTGGIERDLPMQLVLDKYGHKADTYNISLQQFLTYCRKEQCRIYIGIKKIMPEMIEGTLFVTDEALAYNHVLSFSFPITLLETEVGKIRARLYAYIPLQNVTEKFFEQNRYQKIDYEN